jgi:plastocyanin
MLVVSALSLPAAHAGQVRVNVGSGGSAFSPYKVNINEGDHVVWVWIAGTHNVVNWTLDDVCVACPDDSTGFSSDGTIFNSDPVGFGQGSTTRFTWKSDRTGLVPYVCNIHNNFMSGRIFIVPRTTPPTNPVADFRLTEVQFNVPGGLDLIEIANLGQAAGDLRSFRLAIGPSGTGVAISAVDLPVAAGGRVIVHTAESGTNGTPPGHIYLPALGTLPDAAGSVALYVPSTLSPQNALSNADMMIDFVQWGAGGQANEGTANAASFWVPGTSINNVAAGHSIEYCESTGLGHGANQWAEISPPNFGTTGNCVTPTRSESWGRLKIIYRQ